MADRTVTVRILGNADQFKRAMAESEASTARFGGRTATMGKASRGDFEAVGKGALVMAGGLALGLGMSAKAAIDWESAWAGVAKTVDGTKSEMAALEGGLRDLASELPATHGEIAAVAEAAGQLGIQKSAIVGFTKTMIDLGETTDLTADQAATSLAKIANVMGTAQSDFDRMGSSLVALGNSGASTESEILELSQRIAAAGKLAGLTEADIFGFASALTDVGIEAEAGGTAMSKVFTKISDAVLDSNEDLKVFAAVAGVTAKEFSTSFGTDPALAIDSFTQGLGRMIDSGQSLTPVFEALGLTDIRLMNAMKSAAAAGDDQTKSLLNSRAAWEENNALQKEAEKRYDTTAAKMEIARNNAVDLAIDIGGVLLPALGGAAEAASTMARGFGEIDGAASVAVTALGGVSAAGLGLIGVVGVFGPKIVAFKNGLIGMEGFGAMLGRNLGKATLGLGAVAAGVGVLSYVLGRSEASRQKAIDLSKEYAEAIREETGALNDNIDAVSAQKLGEFGGLKEAGADFALLMDSIRGGGDALSELSGDFNAVFSVAAEGSRKAAQDGGASAKIWAGYLEDVGLAGSELGDELTRLKGEMSAPEFDAFLKLLAGLGIGYEEGTALAANLGAAERAVGDEAAGATPKIVGAAGALDTFGAEAEEAEKAAKELTEEMGKAFGAFTEGTDAYQAVIDATRAWAEATASYTADTEDKWEDYYDGFSVNTAEFIAQLEEQVAAQAAWAANLASIAFRGRADLATELEKLGPEGAEIVAKFAEMTDAEFQHAADLWIASVTDGGAEAGQALQTELDVMAAIGASGGRATAQSIADSLDLGVEVVQFIAAKYGVAINTIPNEKNITVNVDVAQAMINVALLAGRVGQLTDQYLTYSIGSVFRASGGLIPHLASGGFPGSPHGTDTVPTWLTPGEYVINARSTRRLGLPMLNALNSMADGGPVPGAGVNLHQGAGGSTTTVYSPTYEITLHARTDDPRVLARTVADAVVVAGRRGIRAA